jgi:SAM-dependent methyltransferase
MRPSYDHRLPLAELPPGSKVLDLGCGPGSVPYLEYPGLRFFGSDQYPDAASARWPSNAALALADAERLPYAGATFDAAVCGFSFEHFSDPKAALIELDRVLRPGAWLHISIPRASSLQDRLYRFTYRGGGHLQRYSLESFLQLVYTHTGFKLEGWAPGAGGFNWLRDVPCGDFLHRLLFRSFRAWAEVGWRPLDASDFLLRFRLGGACGYYRVDYVCGRCGSAISPLDESAHRLSQAPCSPTWLCPSCSFENVRVPEAAS